MVNKEIKWKTFSVIGMSRLVIFQAGQCSQKGLTATGHEDFWANPDEQTVTELSAGM